MTVVQRWLCEPLPRVVAQAIERLAAARGVRRVAVMPDVHLAEHVCVGLAVGTEDWLYPQAVGGDVGCGMAAVRLAADVTALHGEAEARALFAALREHVPVVRQRRPQECELPELTDPALHRRVLRDARIEFGTLGRGNHFLEVQADEQDRLWLMVHSGSRALGPAILAHHVARGEAAGHGLAALPVDGDGGHYWLRDAGIACGWAVQNRRAIAAGAERALAAIDVGVEWDSWFDVVHNFVRCERHGDAVLWVHRKGAASALAGEPGIVPGSMGSRSFHVEGRGCAAALCSSSHGAGRRLARGAAARTISVRDLHREMRGVFFESELAARLRDEAPSAYQDVGAVMRAQHDLVRIVRTLRPVLAYKGA